MELELPNLHGIRLTADEVAPATLLQTNLFGLTSFVYGFEAATALFDSADELTSVWSTQWRHLAAKQSIVEVYNYSMARRGVISLLRSCPTLRGLADNRRLEANKEQFTASFPKLGELRQTVMHQGENIWSEERLRENSTRGPRQTTMLDLGDQNALVGVLEDSRYVATFSGEPVMFEVSAAKVSRLFELTADLLAAFPNAGS